MPQFAPSRIATGSAGRPAGLAILFAAVALLSIVVAPAAQAQTFTVLHSFTGGPDGGSPQGLVAADRGGNVYGSTPYGGTGGCGVVFRSSQKNGNWIFTPLYEFRGGADGCQPFAGVTLGRDGVLYGTTLIGGGTGCNDGRGCGTVFKLTPPAQFCHMALCAWTETVLYRASAPTDPCCFFGGVAVDAAGNIFGMSQGGGDTTNCFGSGCGTVYELSHSGGGYTFHVLYTFLFGADGASPLGTLAVDAAGNIYGAATYGGVPGFGTIFKLVRSGGGYTFNLLYTFTGGSDGGYPQGNVVLDSAGNLFGAAGYNGGVFELTAAGNYSLIVPFLGGLQAPINLDAAGNIYGTNYADGSHGDGSVFELTYSNGNWTHNIIHSFGTDGDGGLPLSGVGIDANGNLYGTTTFGGPFSQGTSWQLAP